MFFAAAAARKQPGVDAQPSGRCLSATGQRFIDAGRPSASYRAGAYRHRAGVHWQLGGSFWVSGGYRKGTGQELAGAGRAH